MQHRIVSYSAMFLRRKFRKRTVCMLPNVM